MYRIRALAALLLLFSACAFGAGVAAPPARAAGTLANGSGSSYVALAMDEWTRTGQTRGIPVNYNGNLGSPPGIIQYKDKQTDFAGTEAEYTSLTGGNTSMPRGYQYVPDVAGAVAIMYNIKDKAGHKVTTLHLNQKTLGKIFTGKISFWDDPAITATNGGFSLPHQPIRVVYRTGQSGTTALFYDFIRHADQTDFTPFFKQQMGNISQDVRIIQISDERSFAFPVGRGTSDAIAQFIASNSGLGAIGYDEFAYARVHNVPAAWVQNGAGQWWQPFAENISEALKDAQLRPDLSQKLDGVYTSKRAKAYPISAYSYMMVQCRNGRSTCGGPYSNSGTADTLAKFMRLVACDGQVKMAQIGYSPLPINLSQEMVNSVARMTGRPAEHLTAANCANPTFRGSLGAGASSPSDPFASLPGGVAAATNGKAKGPSASKSATAGTGLGGLNNYGNGRQQNAKPVSFSGPNVRGLGWLPALALLAIIVVPPAALAVRRWIRRFRGRAPATSAPAPGPAPTPEPEEATSVLERAEPPGEPAPWPNVT